MERPVRSSFQYLSISYECALAIGNSLNLSEMLHEVIRTMVHKTNAHRGVVWVTNGEQELQPVASAGIRLEDVPAQGEIEDLRDVLDQIRKSEQFVLRRKEDKDFLSYCPILTGKEESVLIVPVADVAILHLVYAGRDMADEPLANLLAGLSRKLGVAIEACMVHKKIIDEVQVRERAEEELTKKTEQLISSQKELQGLYGASEQARKSLLSILEDLARKEGALKESESKLKSILSSVDDLVFVFDQEDRFVFTQNATSEMLIITPDKFVGKKPYEVMPSHLNKMFLDAFDKVRKGDVARYDYWLKIDDKTMWFSASHSPRFIDGNFMGSVSTVRNITERVRAAEERELLLDQIREQAQQLEEVMRTVPGGVLLLDAKGQVLMANPAAESALALLVDAQVGDIPRPGSGEAITHLGVRPLAELLTSPPTQGLWHEVTAGNRTFEIIARPMANGPEPGEWVLVINDVTQEREIDRRIQQQERLAAVGQLAAGIAHDFNNIMAVIVLYAQMELSMPDVPARLRDRLQTILQQANLSTALIQQILDFSRRAVLARGPMDLTSFLKEVVKLLERTVPESIKIALSYGRDEYTVSADPTRMQQVIMNLAVNARDAMPEGGELNIALSRVAMTDEIRCVTCGEVTVGEWISIAVTDTGSGIPPDVLPYIFEPFYTTKEVGKGTGLGLAQVHGIVKQHEGHIDVATKMGEGTTFTYYLPALMVHEVAEPSRAVEGAPRGHGEMVLVVEDNAKMREAFADILELLNYQVMIAPNGRSALEILGKYGQGVALVLSDLVMPVMGGKALFYALKEQYPAIRMIMLTGHPMEQELQALQAEGLNGYLLKPPNMEQLAQLVARALGGESES